MSGVRVTDHAVLRYLERVCGVDVEAVRTAIAEGCARHQGAPVVRFCGARFLIRRGTVVTVFAKGDSPSWSQLERLICEPAEDVR